MTKHLSRAELERLATTLPGYFDDIQPRRDIVSKHGAPFSKSDDGRKRRALRKARIADKRHTFA